MERKETEKNWKRKKQKQMDESAYNYLLVCNTPTNLLYRECILLQGLMADLANIKFTAEPLIAHRTHEWNPWRHLGYAIVFFLLSTGDYMRYVLRINTYMATTELW